MYVAMIVALMLVAPLASIAGDVGQGVPLTLALVGKWFVVWTVGVRLATAGLRQIARPRYTAEVVLGLKEGDEALVLVRELGCGNLALGLVGLGGWLLPPWLPAGALAGGVFYALAGIGHARRPRRGRNETVAMASDLWAAVVLLASLPALVRA